MLAVIREKNHFSYPHIIKINITLCEKSLFKHDYLLISNDISSLIKLLFKWIDPINMKIKAVLLDFGGTLADGSLEWDPYHETIRDYLKSLGFSIEMNEVKKALRDALAELNVIRTRGEEMRFEDVYAIFLQKLGINHDDETLEWLHDNFKKYYKTNFFPCLEEVLIELSSKYRLAMVSNTMSDQPKILLREANLDKYFDLLVCSRDLGVRKPNPEIFKIVLDMIDVKPSEAVHVGDSVEADMIGARNTGLTGIWINTPKQPPWKGHTINSICELPRLLETLSTRETS
jgi:HAD superfamily hydrolase (TIGR01549 family)